MRPWEQSVAVCLLHQLFYVTCGKKEWQSNNPKGVRMVYCVDSV
jgi:hypothetical protein